MPHSITGRSGQDEIENPRPQEHQRVIQGPIVTLNIDLGKIDLGVVAGGERSRRALEFTG